jgi:hypothetical protein
LELFEKLLQYVEKKYQQYLQKGEIQPQRHYFEITEIFRGFQYLQGN